MVRVVVSDCGANKSNFECVCVRLCCMFGGSSDRTALVVFSALSAHNIVLGKIVCSISCDAVNMLL
jgi:hypothetical protein